MSRKVSVGIDIGTHNTRVIIAEAGATLLQPHILGTGISSMQGLRRGYIINPRDAARGISNAIALAEKAAKIKAKKAFIAIGGISLQSEIGIGTTTISRIDQEIIAQDVIRAIEASEKKIQTANKKVIHRIPLHYKIDDKEILGRPAGMHGGKLEARVLYVTCLDQHLDDLLGTLEKSGIDVRDVVAAPVAAGVVSLTRPQRTAGCMLVNIGAETVSTAVFENDVLTSLKVFPLGSTDITNDIALGLKIPLEEAEDVKRGRPGNKEYPSKKVIEIVEARLKDIFEPIESHLKKMGRHELLPAGIVIIGGGGTTPKIEDVAKNALKLPARLGIPFSFPQSSFATNLDNSWATAYGLAVLGFDENYQSDLSQIERVRQSGKGNELFSWIKQFFP